MVEPGLVAVLIPVYNSSKILRYCLKSVLEQTYKNIKVFVVNDGSTDNSLEILESFKNEDERVIVYTQENKGVSFARNKCLELAREYNPEYIAFVDSDDLIECQYIEKLVSIISETESDIAYIKSREQSIDTIKDGISDGKYPHWEKNKILSPNQLLSNENYRVHWSMPWCKLYRTHLFDGIEYPDQYYEDGMTTYKVIYKAKKIVCNNSEMYVVVGLPQSLTRTSITLQKITDGLKTVYAQREFYKKHNEKHLELCANLSIANDILMWYQECQKTEMNSVDFDVEKIKVDLKSKFQEEFKNIIKATNMSVLQKILLLFLKKDFKYINLYIKAKNLYVYRDSIVNKLHKVYINLRK